MEIKKAGENVVWQPKHGYLKALYIVLSGRCPECGEILHFNTGVEEFEAHHYCLECEIGYSEDGLQPFRLI